MVRERLARPAVRLALIAVAVGIAVTLSSLDARGDGDPPKTVAGATATVGPVAPTAVAATATPSPLICIDPGHSLTSPSVVVTVPVVAPDGSSHEDELREVDINLDVAREVARRLRARFGHDAVVMTWGESDGLPRTWNSLSGPLHDEKPDVMARGAFCADQGARSIASIHTNWYPDAVSGTRTGYRDANDLAFAEAVQGPILDALSLDPAGTPIPGFHDYGLDQGDWFLALGVDDRDVPVVILEPVMMSDAAEARRLLPTIEEAPDGRRAQIARAEADAIGAWLESTFLAGH